MKIYVINGAATSGKDLFCDVACKLVGGEKYSTIDTFKVINTLYFHWNGEKDEKTRKFLSDFKNLVNEYTDFTFKEIERKIKSASNYWEFYEPSEVPFFIMCREPKEIDRICKQFNAKSIFIRRDSVKPIQSNDADKNVENYDYDFYINNTTLENYVDEIINFLKKENLHIRNKKVTVTLTGEVVVE